MATDLSGVDIAACAVYLGVASKSRMLDTYEHMKAFWSDSSTTCPTEDEIATAWVTVKKNQAGDALEAEYEPQFDAKALAHSKALILDAINSTSNAETIQAEFEALLTEYTETLEAIES